MSKQTFAIGARSRERNDSLAVVRTDFGDLLTGDIRYPLN
jgi:hypothetical protein